MQNNKQLPAKPRKQNTVVTEKTVQQAVFTRKEATEETKEDFMIQQYC